MCTENPKVVGLWRERCRNNAVVCMAMDVYCTELIEGPDADGAIRTLRNIMNINVQYV
jgi:hypothetical protein